jgi:hypothetical protein
MAEEPPPAAYAAQQPLWAPPPARRGFQASLGLQYAFGGGEALEGVDQQDRMPGLGEIEAQLGFKVSRRVFVGAYAALGSGVPGEDTRDVCDDADLSCSSESGRVGLMVKLDLKPEAAGNPWVAIGGGVERQRVDVAAVVPVSDPSEGNAVAKTRLEFTGIEPVRLMAGIDFRSTRALGVGVYTALSFAQYREISRPGVPSTGRGDGDVPASARATHVWFTLGVRGVLFP